MTKPEQDETNDELLLGDLFKPLVKYRRVIWLGTLGVTLLALMFGGLYFFAQPVRWTASLGFRPVFTGADLGEYPNKLPFASTDITDQTVIGQIFEKNRLQDYCTADQFQSALFVEQSSPDLLFLDLEYQGRLADTRITPADRQRLQDEYKARRQTLGVQYRLMFVRPADCQRLPSAIVFKSLGEILETWAHDAVVKRGVLKFRGGALTPAIFEFGDTSDQSQLVHADLVRSALTRVIENARDLQKLPGAELVRVGEAQTSLAEVLARLEDLVQAQLDPLVALAGRGLGRESARWVEESLQVSIARQQQAERVAESYRSALRKYSGAAPTTAGTSPKGQGSADVQTMPAQIDSSFIDRILGMSAENVKFRQELTRQLVEKSVLVGTYGAAVDHYTQLLKSLSSGAESAYAPTEVAARLARITEQGKALTLQFDHVYDEFSRVSFRTGPSLYRIEQPPAVVTLRSFSLRNLFLLVLGVLFVTPFIIAIGCIVRERFRSSADSSSRG